MRVRADHFARDSAGFLPLTFHVPQKTLISASCVNSFSRICKRKKEAKEQRKARGRMGRKREEVAHIVRR